MTFPPEIESGNKEYKLKITTDDNDRIEQLASQMKWRINEGKGTAEYYIGVADNGTIKGINNEDEIKTFENIQKIIKIIDAKIISKNKIKTKDKNKYYYKIIITYDINIINSYRIMFLGPSGSGKSTIIGNLSSKVTDDGNGKSRNFVFNHKHELYSGETSSISIKSMKLKKGKDLININLIDTPGNKKYIKTMITGICKYIPDYIFLVIDPLKIDIETLYFYLKILKYYKYPFGILVTKHDKYKTYHKTYLFKTILNFCNKDYNDENINKIPYIEINNLNRMGYGKIKNILLKCKPQKFNKDIVIQICDVLNVPNLSKIFTGLIYDNIDFNNKYYLTSPNFIKSVKLNTMFFLDKPKKKLDSNHLVTFTFKDNIDFDSRTDLVLSRDNIEQYENIKIKSEEIIDFNQGICIYNNQYSVIKITSIDDYNYILNNIDNTPFINLTDKIIIKVYDKYYFTLLQNKKII